MDADGVPVVEWERTGETFVMGRLGGMSDRLDETIPAKSVRQLRDALRRLSASRGVPKAWLRAMTPKPPEYSFESWGGLRRQQLLKPSVNGLSLLRSYLLLCAFRSCSRCRKVLIALSQGNAVDAPVSQKGVDALLQ